MKKLSKFLLMFITVLSLSSCSVLDAISFFKPGGGIDTELTVGDKKQEVVVGSKQEVVVDKVEGGVNTTTVNEVNPFILIMLILGWLMPTPTAMYKWGVDKWRGK